MTKAVADQDLDKTQDASKQIAPMASSFYRPELDCLRFAAFLLVFASHTLPNDLGRGLHSRVLHALKDAGSFGVPVFFLLSAYLITELLYREKQVKGKINIRNFYVRRILRIWPLYFLALGAAVVTGLVNPAFRIPLAGLLAYLLFAGNWYTVLRGFLPFFATSLWSISVEEQFYILWPSLARFFSRRALVIVSVLVWLSSAGALFVLSARHIRVVPNLWASSLVQFQYFALGTATSLLLKGTVPRLKAFDRALLCLAGLTLFFFSDFTFHAVDPAASSSTLTPVGYILTGAGAVLILLAFLGMKFRSRRLEYLGQISYGLYVYHLMVVDPIREVMFKNFAHFPAKSLVLWLVGLPVTILVSHFSYQKLEIPFLRLKRKYEVVHSRTVDKDGYVTQQPLDHALLLRTTTERMSPLLATNQFPRAHRKQTQAVNAAMANLNLEEAFLLTESLRDMAHPEGDGSICR